MVTWRFLEPHCFGCGSNVPFSEVVEERDFKIDGVFESEGVKRGEIEDEFRDSSGVWEILDDKMVELARILSKRR